MDERLAKFNDHNKGMKVFIQNFFAKFKGEFFSARREDKYTLTLFRMGVVGGGGGGAKRTHLPVLPLQLLQM